MSATAQTAKISLRSIGSSVRALELGVAIFSAIALALAFPKTQQVWLAPIGAAALFWALSRLSWRRAFFTGWLAGTIFFSIEFSWFTYTVGSYVGGLAFAVVLIPAFVEGLAFALTGLFACLAYRTASPWLAPAAAAAAFTVFEWLRSTGELAVPFAQIGYTQTGTPLGVYAAYIGAFGVTFVVMLLGAYTAQALQTRRPQALAVVVLAVGAGWWWAYSAWPARHLATPTLRVAAVQGNIPQSLKKNNLQLAVDRYTSLTRSLKPLHPALVIWPETVILAPLNWDIGMPQNAALRAQFGALARSLHTTLVLGSIDAHEGPRGPKEYNALFTFGPSGALENIYDKRQLVPFTESFPGRSWLGWLPDANLIGRFGHGTDNTVIPVGTTAFAPLICWESAFPDLIHSQIRAGAQFLVVSTDDAWFGETSGTYQHAQIAQMRAIESGEWVVQAASTGISGVISPAGVWTQATALDRRQVLVADVGAPAGSFFNAIGPTRVVAGLALLYALIVGAGLMKRRRTHA